MIIIFYINFYYKFIKKIITQKKIIMQDHTHAIMFHHFHDSFHKPAQGSLSSGNLRDMIIWLKKRYSLIGAKEYANKAIKGILKSNQICLSFDDALKCQFDIALPILDEFKIDAFFFVYSSVFSSEPDFLEIYRFFRTTEYKKIDLFYKDFFEIVKSKNPDEFQNHLNIFKNANYLSGFPFYSKNDKWFRYLRDHYLNENQYHEIMKNLLEKKNFDIELAKKELWMSEKDLINLHKNGHTIGLHSFSHPTQISKLDKTEQKLEYQKNLDHLRSLLGSPIKTMSHPCGNYNQETLQILTELGISIGFRRSMSIKNIQSLLEIPREDHANIFKEMNHVTDKENERNA